MTLIDGNISILHSLGYILLSILLWKTSANVVLSIILSGSLITLHGIGLLLPWFTSIDFEFGLLKAFVWIMWLAAILVCCEAFFEKLFQE